MGATLAAATQQSVNHTAPRPEQQRIVGLLTREDIPRNEGIGGPRSTPDQRAAAASTLADALEAIGLTPRRHSYRLRNVNGLVDLLIRPYRGTNIYAIIEATTPGSSPYVVVGAHYDSEPDCPGAVDNASGVALVYSIASRISQLEQRRVNFILAFFDQEEDDEVGSRAFVRFLRSQDWDVHSVHTADLVGWDADGDRAVEAQSPGTYLESLYRQAAERRKVPLYVTQGASSDNKSFLEAGYRTVAVSEEWMHDDSTPHLHRSTDTYPTLDFEYLSSTTDLVFEVLKTIATDPFNER